jgi:hypothetical protein
MFRISNVEAFKWQWPGENHHRTITEDANTKGGFGFSADALERIIDGNTGQDIGSEFGRPECHGDRTREKSNKGAFRDLATYVNNQRVFVKQLLQQCTYAGTRDALDVLGKALHGLQDLKSHSNYIDLNENDQKAVRDAFKAGTDPPDSLKMTGWGMKEKEDDYHHNLHNKDTPDCPEGNWVIDPKTGKPIEPKVKDAFLKAKQSAIDQTVDFLNELKADLGDALWHKLVGWESTWWDRKFTTATSREFVPHSVVKIDDVIENRLKLNYTIANYTLGLNITELLPHGIQFISAYPTPLEVETIPLSTPDEIVTLIKWYFYSDVPLGPLEITYQAKVTPDVLQSYSYYLDNVSDSRYFILFTGSEAVVVDVNNTIHRSMVGGDIFMEISAAVHDMTVTNVTPSKTVVGQGYSLNINVTAANQGNFTETFDVTLYVGDWNETRTIYLPNGTSTILTFTWNTTGFTKGNYTIWAYAWPVPGETDTDDNTLIDGWVVVTWPGDFDGDSDVDEEDLWYFCAYFITYHKEGWMTAMILYDFDNNCKIDEDDLWTFCGAFIDYWKAH